MATRAGREAEGDLLDRTQLEELTTAAVRLHDVASERGVMIATAESCTGGLVGHAITEIPGSSAYFVGGIISYSNAVKADALDVPETTIERHGAVSAQVAKAMADGVRTRMGADYAVAVTGVAGPDGGTAEKPVGLTYVAVSGPEDDEVQRYSWDGNRSENKLHSANAALDLLFKMIARQGVDQNR